MRLRKNPRPSDIQHSSLGYSLQVGETGFEIAADHLVHVRKDAHDLRNVGAGAVHGPGDGRRVALGLDRKFSRILALERLDEVKLDGDLRWLRRVDDLHPSLADLAVALPGIRRSLARR